MSTEVDSGTKHAKKFTKNEMKAICAQNKGINICIKR